MAKSPSTDPDEKPRRKKKDTNVTRDTELSTREDIKDQLDRVVQRCEQSFMDQRSRASDQADYWDIYECVLNDNQAYNGNTQAYIPLVADAIDARKTRFTNQLFPINGRYVDVVSQNGEIPYAEMALAEHYIKKAKLRTDILPALCKNGDVEGHYSVYVSWQSLPRHVVSRKTTQEGGSKVDVVEEEVVYDDGPKVECLPDADIAVWPYTADSIQEALSNGGGVGITRRWTRTMIEDLIESGDLVDTEADNIISEMETASLDNRQDMKKEHVWDTGIHAKGSWYLAREVWHMLKINGERRLCRSYFGTGSNKFMGTKLCPYWCDLPPVISGPVEKVSGAFKGVSKLRKIGSLQYAANDFLNEACDSATYSMMPIVMTNPEKNPKTSTMILDLAAVWETSPQDTQFAKFPDLWKSGFELISAFKSQIQQSLGVNPSMIPATSGKDKRSQADIANEQAVDILTTADSVTVLEDSILTPLLQRILYYDQQYRVEKMMIPMFGMMGKRAQMQDIPPIQMGNAYEFEWLGVQAARNAQQIQQQIGFINVLKGVPPQMYKNHRIDLTAMLENAVENIFGPRLGPLTFVDLRDELSMSQDEENPILLQGFGVPVSPMDNDQEHIQKVMPICDPNIDISGTARTHLQMHQQQMQQKAQAQQMQAAQQQGLINAGQPGQQGQQPGMPPGPGQPGSQEGGPREGGQPGMPRPQGPPGQIHPDALPRAGAVPMPRRVG